MKKLAFVALLLLCGTMYGQIFEKGAIIGPLTSTEIMAYPNPSEGLTITNTTTETVWVYLNGAWVDTGSGSMTDAQVKTAYENNPDTNAFTDAEKAKLAGVASGMANEIMLGDGSHLDLDNPGVGTARGSVLSLDSANDVNVNDHIQVINNAQFRMTDPDGGNQGKNTVADHGMIIESYDASNRWRIVNRKGYVSTQKDSTEIGIFPQSDLSQNPFVHDYEENRWEIATSPVLTQANAASLGLAMAADFLPLDGSSAMTANLDLGGNDITGIAQLDVSEPILLNAQISGYTNMLAWEPATNDPFALVTSAVHNLMWMRDGTLNLRRRNDGPNIGATISFAPTQLNNYTLPDKSGTFALLDDISGSSQTLSLTDTELSISGGNNVDLSNIATQKVADYTALAGLTGMVDGDVAEIETGPLKGKFAYDSSLSATDDEGSIIDGWSRQFDGEYLRPQWFGATMDGTTDDRDAFIKTLAAANTRGLKVLIDKDIFLDVAAEGTKSIFLEDNTWIEGEGGANIILNNLNSPAFYIALTKDITIKNITFLYDNSYDADQGDLPSTLNRNQLKNYLETNKGITYNAGQEPLSKGFKSYLYIFSLQAPENVLFDNVTFKALGTNANSFIAGAIKLTEQHQANQTVADDATAPKSEPKNITLNNVTMDGVLMGVQGIVDGFKSDGLRSYRYSDWQDVDGTSIGGYNWDAAGGYSFPPPHLIYLNNDDSSTLYSQNIKILNTVDHGIYVGTSNVRPTTSGYCVSLTLTGTHENVLVDNYVSYRRDGFLGVDDMTNGTFRNIYTEYDSSIFTGVTTDYNNIRFIGDLDDVTFENVIVKDRATTSIYYPMDFTDGNNSTWSNVHVYVKDLNTTAHGFFGINGSGNKIINSGLNIETHSSTQSFRGLIYNNDATRNSGSNNFYDIYVNGWRDFSSSVSSQISRTLFASSQNDNNNYARLRDISNSAIIENENGELRETITFTELVDLGTGTSQNLTINIPRYFNLKKISAETVSDLAAGQTVSIGQATTNDLIASVPLTTDRAVSIINELNPDNSTNRTVTIHTDTDFASTGEIKVTLEVQRIKSENNDTFQTVDLSGSGVSDGSITTAKLDDDAVTTTKIAPGAVQSSDILDGTIGQGKLSVAYETTLVKNSGSGRTNPIPITEIYAQSQSDYDTDGAAPANHLVVINNATKAKLVTTGSFDFSKAKTYHYDDSLTDAGTITFSNLEEGAKARIKFNRASAPTFSGASPVQYPGTYSDGAWPSNEDVEAVYTYKFGTLYYAFLDLP